MPNSGASDPKVESTLGIDPMLISGVGAPVDSESRVHFSVWRGNAFLSQLERRLPRTISRVAPLREDLR